MIDLSEKNFEERIERALLSGGPDALPGETGVVRESAPPYGESAPGGYHKRSSDDYDRALCLIPADVLDFLYASQPKVWETFKKQHGADARAPASAPGPRGRLTRHAGCTAQRH